MYYKRLQAIPNKPQTVYFPIIPRTIGSINIDVSARSAIAADAVQRQLLVHVSKPSQKIALFGFTLLSGMSQLHCPITKCKIQL